MVEENGRVDVLRKLRGTFQPDWSWAAIRNLEQATFETHGHDRLLYEERVRALIFAAPHLQSDDPRYVAGLDTPALRGETEQAWYDALRRDKDGRRDEAEMLARFQLVQPDAGPALLRCSKCQSTEVEWHQRQTRSADEAATTFCQCLSCGKRWRQ